jgi:hypothetical protein
LSCQRLFLMVLVPLRPAAAASWYFLRYLAPPGHQFTSLSGNVVIPSLPKVGVSYLWPGLQPSDNSGVYQNVVDGRTGSWWISNGWCCQDPKLPWGTGFIVNPGDIVTFKNTKNSKAWTSTLINSSSGQSVTNTFQLGACFCMIEDHMYC